MSAVHRRRPLPVTDPRGRLLVTAPVIDATHDALRSSRGDDGRHEGLVFWAGWMSGDHTVAALAIVPATDHGWGHVRASEPSMLEVARQARRFHAGVLVQVHSHGGWDTRHSDGDDEIVHMPFEGMWSVVVADYGNGLGDPRGLGLHQFQDGQWVSVPLASGALVVVPTAIP